MDKLQRPAIEYNLTEHCNLSCYGCDHASPLFPKRNAEVESFERDMRALSQALHVKEIRIVGGEPLLHSRLVDFLRVARDSGIADRVVIYTNGVLLHKAPKEMWGLIDELRWSVYPGVRMQVTPAELAALSAEHGVELSMSEMNEFQVILVNRRIEEPRLVREIFRVCETSHSWSCHAIYEGRYYKCSIAPFVEVRTAMLGTPMRNLEADGVPLHGNPDLRGSLERYLADVLTPLKACDYCLGTSGPMAQHRQLDGAEGRKAWLTEDHTAVIAETRKKLLGGG